MTRTRLGLLLVALAIAAAAPLTAAHTTLATDSHRRNEVTGGVLTRHDQSAVFPIHRLHGADRAIRHAVDAWWAVPFVLAALMGGWVLRESRRSGRSARTVVAFRRRGPPQLLPLVV